jgi:hypothetical protein
LQKKLELLQKQGDQKRREEVALLKINNAELHQKIEELEY